MLSKLSAIWQFSSLLCATLNTGKKELRAHFSKSSFLPACFLQKLTYLLRSCLPACFLSPACLLPITCLPASFHLPACFLSPACLILYACCSSFMIKLVFHHLRSSFLLRVIFHTNFCNRLYKLVSSISAAIVGPAKVKNTISSDSNPGTNKCKNGRFEVVGFPHHCETKSLYKKNPHNGIVLTVFSI